MSSLPTQTCKYCHKPLSECREADKQLITPLNPLYATETIPITRQYALRNVKAFKYKLGCYDTKTNLFYGFNHNVTDRLRFDTYLSLPMCVWEDQFNKIGNICRSGIQKSVVYFNLKDIPIDKEYITILFFLTYGVVPILS